MAETSQGKHHLLLELGRGGMGTVYLALARGPGGFNKLKVLKRLRADLANDEQFLTMFLDEARLSARLNHPNVVQTNEVGFDGVHYFIEMEYLEGQSFDALLRRASKVGGPPIEVALSVLAQTLAGLHYAHELRDHSGPLRIVHRDVSPHNVLVTYDGAVKVLDFGIAKAVDSSSDTTTGVVKGKATYMAPEQAARGTVDRRADVFAVGVMLWETLTRRRMYAGLGDFEIFLALQRGAPPPPRTVDDSVPAELDAICAKALAHKAEERFATAAEMQLALEDEIAKRSTRAGPRALASVMNDLFAERRAAVQSEIDARMRELERGDGASARTSVDVPVLGQAKAYVATGTGPTRTKNLAVPSAEATRAALPSGRRIPIGAGVDRVSGAEGGRTKSAVISDVPPRPRPRTRRAWLAALGGLGLACVAAFGIVRKPRPLQPAPVATSASVSGVANGCTTNRACTLASRGRASVCVHEAGNCAVLESEDCHLLAEPGVVADERTLWFGVMLPQKGAGYDANGRTNTNVIELARRDFMTTTNGLPWAGHAPRPLGLVVCDDQADPARAAAHLVEAGVPAVIGFGSPKEVIDLYASTFLPKRTLLLEAINTNALITQLPRPEGGPRLVWRTTESAVQCAAPLAAFVSSWLEPRLSKARGHVGKTKVAFVRNSSSSSLSIADSFAPALTIDGESLVANADSFRQIVFSSGNAGDDVERAVATLVSFAPHVIVYLTGEEFVAGVLRKLEARWPKALRYRPTYVESGILVGDSLYDFVGSDPERRRRFFGVELPANTTTNLRFVLRYNESFSPPITPGTAPGVLYDAFYLLAYAAAAAGDHAITGQSLAAAFPRLVPPGAPKDVGPSAIFETANILASGKNVDLMGAGTPLDLDEATGESPSDFAVYCLKADSAGKVSDAVESGLRYDLTTGKITGESHCE